MTTTPDSAAITPTDPASSGSSPDDPGPETASTSATSEIPADTPPPLPGGKHVHTTDEYRCITCGYSLRGLAATGSCPECRTLYEPLPPRIPAGYVCYRCSYSLADMPTDGACPECGTNYSFAHAFRGLPYPGQFSLVMRLGWPALIAAPMIFFVMLSAWSPRGSLESLACPIALLFIANLLNFPISTSHALRNYVPPSKRKGYFAAFRSLGGWVLTAWILAGVFLLGPVLAIGLAILFAIFSKL